MSEIMPKLWVIVAVRIKNFVSCQLQFCSLIILLIKLPRMKFLTITLGNSNNLISCFCVSFNLSHIFFTFWNKSVLIKSFEIISTCTSVHQSASRMTPVSPGIKSEILKRSHLNVSTCTCIWLTCMCMCCGIGLLECLLLTYISNWFWSFDLVVSFLTLYWVTRVLSTVPWSFTAFSCYTCFYFYMYINPHLYIKM